MNTVVPITIVLSLGVFSGMVLRFWFSNKLVISMLGGIFTTFLWGLGMYVLFSLTESDEPGKTHYQGIVYVFLIGFAASFVTCCIAGKKEGQIETAVD